MLFHNSIQDIYGLAWATFTTTDKFIYDKNLDCIVLETSLCLGLLLGQKFGSLENFNWFFDVPSYIKCMTTTSRSPTERL